MLNYTLIKLAFIIGLGGFAGSVGRYYVQQAFEKMIPSAFPYGTLTVNIAGSLAIGIIISLVDSGKIASGEMRFFLITGLCGGFTTFSSFTYESFALLKGGDFLSFSLYIIISLALGLICVYAGFMLGRQF